MAKKWKVGAIYKLVNKTGFLEYVYENKQLLPYVSDKFKVLEIDELGNVASVENIDLSGWSDWVILAREERKFFRRVKD